MNGPSVNKAKLARVDFFYRHLATVHYWCPGLSKIFDFIICAFQNGNKGSEKKVHGQNLIFTSHTNKTETSMTVYAAKVALKNDTRESMID